MVSIHTVHPEPLFRIVRVLPERLFRPLGALPPFVLEFKENQAAELLLALGSADIPPTRSVSRRYILDFVAAETRYPGFGGNGRGRQADLGDQDGLFALGGQLLKIALIGRAGGRARR